MIGKYILKGKVPVPEPDLMAWGLWLESADRHVRYDYLEGTVIYISTVFLGLDHNYSGKGAPVLFETMVFANGDCEFEDTWTRRYCTWDEAETGHGEILHEVLETLESQEENYNEILTNTLKDLGLTIR